MFAEFEKIIHEMAEAGEPLTVESFQERLSRPTEGLLWPELCDRSRIGAWSAFASRIFTELFTSTSTPPGWLLPLPCPAECSKGGQQELADYLQFLSSGCSRDPLDLLAAAGVDMTSPQPVATALQHFGHLVKQLDELTL